MTTHEQPLPAARAARTNPLAVAALATGLLWPGLGSILALVFGHKAQREIDASGGTETGRGMATAGIVLGWIGLYFVVFVVLCALYLANV
jgi:hypothetical protein